MLSALTNISEDTLWFFIFVIIIVLLARLTGIFPAIALAAAGVFRSGEKTGGYDDSNELEEILGGDTLRDYLDGNTLSPDTASKIDAKDLKLAKLRAAAKKQITLESFVDKLVANTVLYLKSLDRKPSDLAIAAVGPNKALLIAAADIIEKKYTDSRYTPADLRELAKKITSKTAAKYDDLVRIGDISREELIAKYISLMTSETSDCDRELKSVTSTNETLRLNNEKLRAEISRGLTDYTCEALLRDCRIEKDRLLRDIEAARMRPDSDNYRREAQDLQKRVSELQSIISAMQNADARPNLDAGLQNQIVQLENELSKCAYERDQLVTMVAQSQLDSGQ